MLLTLAFFLLFLVFSIIIAVFLFFLRTFLILGRWRKKPTTQNNEQKYPKTKIKKFDTSQAEDVEFEEIKE